jgi:hypothetical protein
LQIALTAELVRLGIPVKRAATAALAFTDSGNVKRQPGELFADGYTMLILGPDPDRWEVVNVTDASRLVDAFTRYSGAAMVLIDQLHEHVRGALANGNKEPA